MGSLFNAFKKFFVNKTTVTIVGVVAGIAVLVGFYMYRVNSAVDPTRVPIATRAIAATEEITSNDVEWVEIGSSFLKNRDIITDIDDIVGKYVNTGTSIPEGGMFYTSQVVEKEELPNSVFDEIPDGYTIYQLRVNIESTYSNSIYPGDKIDLWMTLNQDDLIYFGEFITGIEVLAVRDSDGESVFDVTNSNRPAWLLFAVPTEMYRYLKVAEFLDITITPVPRNTNYNSEVGTTEISNDQLLYMLQSRIQDMGGDYS